MKAFDLSGKVALVTGGNGGIGLGMASSAAIRGAVLPRIPLRRWGTKEDFAGIAVYLMSDASGYHSGDNFVIDGAYTIF